MTEGTPQNINNLSRRDRMLVSALHTLMTLRRMQLLGFARNEPVGSINRELLLEKATLEKQEQHELRREHGEIIQPMEVEIEIGHMAAHLDTSS